MPFKSEAQRRFMFSQHPDIAKKWTAEFGSKSMNNRTSGPGPANLEVPGSKPMGNLPPWLQKGKGKAEGKSAAASRKMAKNSKAPKGGKNDTAVADTTY